MTERLNNKYVGSKNMTQTNLPTIQKEAHGQTEQTCGGEGSGRLELVDVSYYIWDG